MDRVEDFIDKRFGLFIHFGLFSQIERGEWIWYCDEKIRENYRQYFDSFNPQNLDWKAIIELGKKAGIRYAVLTTRHHDGFSLYDTCGINEYDVMHTPYHRDVVREFVEECNRQGVLCFLYHTMHDWQNPLFTNDFEEYLEYHRESVKLLCTNYGKIGGFWFDGNWSNKQANWHEDELYGMIRHYQPDAIIINNSGLANRGKRGHKELDTITFEQGSLTPVDQSRFDRKLASEVCQTMNRHWGASYQDIDYKSPRELIEMLCKCRKQNANYLLNIGPNGDGTLPIMQEALLKTISIWMDYASEVFFGGQLSEIQALDKDFVLDYQNKSYVFVHDMPLVGHKHVVEAYGNTEEKNCLKQVSKKVKRIYWKDNNEDLLFTQKGNEVTFRAVGFQYGVQLIVRIAVIEFE